MVDGGLGREYYCRMVEYRHFLLTEFLSAQAFDFNERTEYYLHAVFICYFKIRGLLRCGFGLRNEYLVYFHYCAL